MSATRSTMAGNVSILVLLLAFTALLKNVQGNPIENPESKETERQERRIIAQILDGISTILSIPSSAINSILGDNSSPSPSSKSQTSPGDGGLINQVTSVISGILAPNSNPPNSNPLALALTLPPIFPFQTTTENLVASAIKQIENTANDFGFSQAPPTAPPLNLDTILSGKYCNMILRRLGQC